MKSNSEQLNESLSLSTTESEKAWHIFSLLVFIGKPTPLPELASHCSLFPASPTLISSLCSIPNSPITLSNDKHFVAISSIGISFFAVYLSRNFTVADAFTSSPIRFGGFPKIWLLKRKRDAAYFAEDEEERELILSVKRIRNYCTKVHYHLTDDISRIVELSKPLVMGNNIVLNSCWLAESSARQLSCKVEDIENVESEMNVEDYMRRNVSKELVASEPEVEPIVPTGKPDHEIDTKAVKINHIYSPECDEQRNISVVVGGKFYVDFSETNFRIADNEVIAEDSKKEEKLDLASKRQGVEDLSPSFNISLSNIPPERDLKSLDEDNCNHKMPSLSEEHLIVPAGASVIHSVTKLSVPMEQLTEPSEKAKTNQRYMVAPLLQTPNKSLGHTKVVNTYKRKQHCERNHLLARTAQKSTQNHKDIYVKERRGNSTSISSQVVMALYTGHEGRMMEL